jgi:hypothetical protein
VTKLERPDGEPSIIPDFILKPNDFNLINKTEVFEIKLPAEGIVKKKLRKRNLQEKFAKEFFKRNSQRSKMKIQNKFTK